MQQRSYFIFALVFFIVCIFVFFIFSFGSKKTEDPAQKPYENFTTKSNPHDTTTTSSETYLTSSNNVLSPIPAFVEEAPPISDLTLWRDIQNAKQTDLDGVPALTFQVDVTRLDHLAVGQKLYAATPQSNGDVTAELSHTHNELDSVEVWTGKIEGGNASDMMIVTRGQTETHVVISTSEGVITTIINNQTGIATMIDEADYVANQIPIDDGIQVNPIDDTPPAHLTQITEFSVGEVSNGVNIK